MGKRVVYQRPLPHYTMLHLLQTGLIDENLYPVAHKDRNLELTGASDEVVRAGLRRLLGENNYRGFQSLKTSDRRYRALIAALEAHVDKATTDKRQEIAAAIDVSDFR